MGQSDLPLYTKKMKKGTLIQITLPSPKYKDKLALVVDCTKDKSVDVRMYSEEHNRFSNQLETISLKYVQEVFLPTSVISKMACGKRVLSENAGNALLAGNEIFKEKNRQEQRLYYCTKCQGFHSTSQAVRIPSSIFHTIQTAPPISACTVEGKPGLISAPAVFKYIRDVLGLRISKNIFSRAVIDYGGTVREGLEKIIKDPTAFLSFYFGKKALTLSHERHKDLLHQKQVLNGIQTNCAQASINF